jgi:hypothetical protein
VEGFRFSRYYDVVLSAKVIPLKLDDVIFSVRTIREEKNRSASFLVYLVPRFIDISLNVFTERREAMLRCSIIII